MVGTQSWKRFLGLSSRAIILTVQRILDSYSVCRHVALAVDPNYPGHYLNANSTTLLVVLLLTTAIMAFTLSKHWSARLHGRPYGAYRGAVLAIFQVAALWEMYDKLCTHGRPDSTMLPTSNRNLEEKLLEGSTRNSRSHPPKGSPGENTMRGLRKICIANIPQAAISLWFHTYMVLPVYPPTDPLSVEEDRNGSFRLVFSFAMALLCLALGVADFVLYIWVDDVFVRSNKKLVTLYYFLEIMARVPVVVLFHVTFTRFVWSGATLTLLLVDVLITSTSLLVGRLLQPNVCCFSLSSICQKQTLLQFLYSLVVSFILFFVNIVCFDPGMIASGIDRAQFFVKSSELALQLYLIRQTEKIIRNELPYWFFHKFETVVCLCAVGNFCILFFIAPNRRNSMVQQMMRTPSILQTPPRHPPSREVSIESPHLEIERRRHGLKTLEEIFELLYLLSCAECGQNRARILDMIGDELWLLALCWDGVFCDNAGQVVHIVVDTRQARSLTFCYADKEPVIAQIRANEIFVPTQLDFNRGVFDGKRLHWDSGVTWERKLDTHDQLDSTRAILRLVLPQLTLALKWSIQPQQGSCTTSGFSESLLVFLVRYATIARRADFLSDLYWSLYCLSDVPGPDRDIYENARQYLLRYLSCDFGDIGIDCSALEREFLLKAKQLLQNQREIWKQNQALFNDHSGRSSGGGAYILRTQELREALMNWAYRSSNRSSRVASDFDEQMLSTAPLSANMQCQTEGDVSIDLVNVPAEAGGEHISFPVDPNVRFLGVVVDESEVIPSKQAPLMLTCRTRLAKVIESPREDLPGATKKDEEAPKLERYLLKFGDDLRQDQLMLQLMELITTVWQEHLPPETAKMLKFDLFRVLAIRPNAGYVKCVPNAVPLSDALRESQGHLENWLQTKCFGDTVAWNTNMDRFCSSVAASCVMTYVLGIGDRHLENICITDEGFFFHVDFSFVLGDDPKPIAPPVRLPQQVSQALKRTNRLSKCFDLAGEAYRAIRPFAGLLSSLLRFTAEAGGAGCTKLEKNASFSIAGVRERLRIDQVDDERAIAEFICLMRESSEGWSSILLDKIHAAGLFWR